MQKFFAAIEDYKRGGFLSSKQWKDRGKIQWEFHNEQCESIFHVGDNNHKGEAVKDGFFLSPQNLKTDIFKNK